MLKGCSGLAAITLCLVAASPCEGRNRQLEESGQDGPARSAAATRSDSATIVLSGIGRKRLSREPAMMPLRDPDLRAPADGPVAAIAQSGMLGRLPLHERVDIGVGLFAVTGASFKEREFRRTDPMRDVAPRMSRVAGAGVRVNF